MEADSTYNRAFAQAHLWNYVEQRGAIISPAWSDWSARASEEIVESDTIQAEKKEQYRIAPVSESTVLDEWCDGVHADAAGYQIERRTLYRYRTKQ